MTIAIALSAVTGIAIGFRFNIYMVVLAVLAAAAASMTFAIAQGEQPWSLAAILISSAIALQVGYLCASFAVSMREPAVSNTVEVAAASAKNYQSQRSLSA